MCSEDEICFKNTTLLVVSISLIIISSFLFICSLCMTLYKDVSSIFLEADNRVKSERIEQKDMRIEELEEILKENAKITAV